MSSSQAGGFRLPLPGSPESSVGAYTSRISALLKRPDVKVMIAFWLFGTSNNPSSTVAKLTYSQASSTTFSTSSSSPQRKTSWAHSPKA